MVRAARSADLPSIPATGPETHCHAGVSAGRLEAAGAPLRRGQRIPGGHIVLLLLLGVVLRGAGAAQSPPQTADATIQAHLESARAAQAAQDYGAAASEYASIVELQPANALVRQSLGVALHLAGRYPEAILHLREAVRLDGRLWGAYLFLGMDSYRVGQYEQALAALQRSLALNPKLVEASRWLGLTCAALGRFELAISHLSSVRENEGADEETLYHLAKAYDNRADQLFEQIGREEPDSPFVFLLQAERFAFEGEAGRARAELERAAEQRPDLAGISFAGVAQPAADSQEAPVPDEFSAVRSSFLNGRYAAAAKLAKDALGSGPDRIEGMYWLGRSYKGLAAATLEQLAEVAPDSYRADQLEAEFHAAKTEFSKALAAYQRALAKRPQLPGLRYAIGVVHWRAGRFAEAVRWLEEELGRNPHHVLARHRLGSILLDLGRPEDALRHLVAASGSGSSSEARFDLGRAHLEVGDYPAAAGELEVVVRSEPSHERARFLLARAYRAMGRVADAARELEVYQRLNRERLRRVQQDVRSVSEDLKGDRR